ncbi:MAG: hypothetical protein VYD64_04200 [Pseudomonadota bacterium]|nr:hypothetical protein [Pseudomonadota bacterium]MEC9367944.1 hypothetical protein [Pseudomonadota bacterium]
MTKTGILGICLLALCPAAASGAEILDLKARMIRPGVVTGEVTFTHDYSNRNDVVYAVVIRGSNHKECPRLAYPFPDFAGDGPHTLAFSCLGMPTRAKSVEFIMLTLGRARTYRRLKLQ